MKRIYGPIVVSIGAVVLLAACSRQAAVVVPPATGGGAAASAPAEEPVAAAPAEPAQAPAANMEAAAALVNQACTSCHDLGPIEASEGSFSEAQWRDTIDRMVGYGAGVTPDETDQIVAYLLTQGANP